MSWTIAAIIFPIPFFHLWLHALLPWWKKYPFALYTCGAALWAGSFLIFRALDPVSPAVFSSSPMIRMVGFFLLAIGAAGALSSFLTLGPRRFFVWAVLRPESLKAARLFRGPFRVIPHPAYVGYLAFALGNFLISGAWYLAGVLIVLLFATPIVIWLEEEEMRGRLGGR